MLETHQNRIDKHDAQFENLTDNIINVRERLAVLESEVK